MVAQDILRIGGKNFAAGSGKGKNVDEQLARAGITGEQAGFSKWSPKVRSER